MGVDKKVVYWNNEWKPPNDRLLDAVRNNENKTTSYILKFISYENILQDTECRETY